MIDILADALQMVALGGTFGRRAMAHKERRVVVGVRVAVVPRCIVGLIEPLVGIAALAGAASSIERAQT